MALDPLTIGLSALGGLFGKRPEWNGPQRQMQRLANQFEAMGNAPALSSPDEQASLAEQLGILGQQAGAQQNRLFASLGPQAGLTPEARADMLKNLASNQLQTQANARLQALMASWAQKKAALSTAAQIAGSVGTKQQPGPNQFPELVGQLAYLNKLRQGQGAGQPGAGVGAGAGGGGGSIWPQTAQVGGATAFPGMAQRPAPTTGQTVAGGMPMQKPAFGGGDLAAMLGPQQSMNPFGMARPPAASPGYDISQFTTHPTQSPMDRSLSLLRRAQGLR